ncbi:putative phage terminase large subunit-like protein [Pseudorhizobium tarimense]|uniref:Phage terminase large subunit-like protein n=1 Tax=Pseudorhizobium tarimense TaxID=1079109 RepID=A0ABV2HBF7_9HYPH|nr:phage terminase large subunit [Pseudorhizobium tarimense]MCJ8520754.1 phage terminase large subunit [Pseudorhizobium tarimense]
MAATGDTPLDYMLKVMRDNKADPGRRDDMAKAAARYVHPKLASLQHTGRNGGPIQTVDLLAATKKTTAARTARVKLRKADDGSYVVGHVVTTKDEGNAVRRLIKTTAELDGTDVLISLPQDPGQAGKVQAKDYVSMLAGWTVKADPETDKVTRAEPFLSQCEVGNVFLVQGAWNEAYLDELCLFPGGAFKDQVDATPGAFGRLVGNRQSQTTTTTVKGLY